MAFTTIPHGEHLREHAHVDWPRVMILLVNLALWGAVALVVRALI